MSVCLLLLNITFARFTSVVYSRSLFIFIAIYIPLSGISHSFVSSVDRLSLFAGVDCYRRCCYKHFRHCLLEMHFCIHRGVVLQSHHICC